MGSCTDPIGAPDIVARLRAMSRYEHDDLSIGDEAADEIKRLQRVVVDTAADAGEVVARLHAELRHARDGLTKGRARMREDNERLRAALQRIVSVMGPAVPPCCGGCAAEWEEALTTAREALADKP